MIKPCLFLNLNAIFLIDISVPSMRQDFNVSISFINLQAINGYHSSALVAGAAILQFSSVFVQNPFKFIPIEEPCLNKYSRVPVKYLINLSIFGNSHLIDFLSYTSYL